MLEFIRRHPRFTAASLALGFLGLGWPSRFYQGPYETVFVEELWEPAVSAFLYFLGRVVLVRPRVSRYALVACAVLLGNELLQMVEIGFLDDLRWTLPGEVILGRDFSTSHLVAVAAGVLAAACLDAWTGPRGTGAGNGRGV